MVVKPDDTSLTMKLEDAYKSFENNFENSGNVYGKSKQIGMTSLDLHVEYPNVYSSFNLAWDHYNWL